MTFGHLSVTFLVFSCELDGEQASLPHYPCVSLIVHSEEGEFFEHLDRLWITHAPLLECEDELVIVALLVTIDDYSATAH